MAMVTVNREDLMTLLVEVEAALDDASSVVEAGDDERYAYEPQLTRLRRYLKALEE